MGTYIQWGIMDRGSWVLEALQINWCLPKLMISQVIALKEEKGEKKKSRQNNNNSNKMMKMMMS